MLIKGMDIKIKSEKISRLVWLIQIQQKICWDNFFEKNLLYGISYTKKHLRAFPFMSRLYRCTLYIWSYQKDVTKQKHTCGRITMYISTLLYHTLKGDDKMLVSLLSFAKKNSFWYWAFISYIYYCITVCRWVTILTM